MLWPSNNFYEINISGEDYNFNTSTKEAISETKIKTDTVPKPKLHCKNYNVSKKNKNIKEKYKPLKEVLSEVKRKKYLSSDQLFELNLKAEAVEDTNKLIGKHSFKYTPALRKFAVTLHFYSVAGYKFVRNVYKGSLPHSRIIGKWYENRSGNPGFSKEALDVLNKKYKARGQRLYCTLIADEIVINHPITWDGKKTTGVDFGAGSAKSYEIATKAYVFVLVSMNESWKIPIAYFLVNELSAEFRANLLKTCLVQCYNVGVDIFAITFDGCAASLNAAELLGCNLKNPKCLKTTFKHPEDDYEVAVLLDPCHMMKLIRNTCEAKRLIIDENGKRIRWQLLTNLVKFQKNVTLNFANKFSPRHIHFRNEIMKVHLGTRSMSRSVANTLKLCNEIVTSSLFIDTEGTINFITILNNLFDILNSKSSDSYGLKKPISEENSVEVFDHLETARSYILGLSIHIKYRHLFPKHTTINVVKTRIVESRNRTGFLGLLICIESIQYLFTLLVKGRLLKYLQTYRLSQDNVEILFGHIKGHGGYNNNPNAIQFKEIFKKYLQHIETRSFLGNLLPLANIPTLICSSAVQNINCSVSKRAYDDEEILEDIEDEENTYTIDTNVEVLSGMLKHETIKKISDQIVGYISGWVSMKLMKLLKCETCTDRLLSKNKLWFHKLIVLKNMEGLCYSSEDVYKICLNSENIIRQYIKQYGSSIFGDARDIEHIKNRILKSFIGCNVFDTLNNHSLEQHPTHNHRLHLIRAVVDRFINARIHFDYKNNPNDIMNKLSLFYIN